MLIHEVRVNITNLLHTHIHARARAAVSLLLLGKSKWHESVEVCRRLICASGLSSHQHLCMLRHAAAA